nr:NAD/NADP octopine/nopaline dehydrogenase family protein [Candidatus Sigynarchaeota archaeon]
MLVEEITVIGAGNGGRAFAAYLARKGYKVNLCYRTPESVRQIKESKTIVVEGEIEGTFDLNMVTDRYDLALKTADLLLLVVPASAHVSIVKEMLPHLRDEQIILLNPGRTWGAIHVKNVITSERPNLRVYVGETETLLFTCRAIEDRGVTIFKIKNSMDYCFYPESDNAYIDYILSDIFPNLSLVDDIRVTSLTNIGAIIHPAAVVLNAGAISRQDGFLFYREGLTKEVVNVIENVDKERCSIMERIGMAHDTFLDWAKKTYGVLYDDYFQAFQNIVPYKDIGAPNSLFTRYITEDVPTGLVPFSSMGEYFDIKTPFIDSIILMASSLVGQDFKASGRTLEHVGVPYRLIDRLEPGSVTGEGLPVRDVAKISSQVQYNLYKDWMIVMGPWNLVNIVKKCYHQQTGHRISPLLLKQHAKVRKGKEQPFVMTTMMKSEELQRALELGNVFPTFLGFEIDARGDDFKVLPFVYYDDRKVAIKELTKKVTNALNGVLESRGTGGA